MDNGPTEHPDVRYERKDIRFGPLLGVMAAAVCVLAAVGYGAWQFYWWDAGVEQAAKRSPYLVAPGLNDQLPPEPRLKELDRMAGVESADVRKRLAAQEKALRSYGPTDERGFVHIPIEQAIKAVAGNLPVRNQSPGPAAKQSGRGGSR
jgi:hypothetical protein